MAACSNYQKRGAARLTYLPRHLHGAEPVSDLSPTLIFVVSSEEMDPETERLERPMLNRNDPVHVVVAADRRFLWGCAVTIRSVLDNYRSNRPLRTWVVHDSLPREDQEALRSSWNRTDGGEFEAAFVQLPVARVSGLNRSKHLSRMMYARLLIGEILGQEVTRCVYLDSDLLFERDIAELDQLDLCGRTVGAVPNGVDAASESDDLLRLGLPAGGRYLNSGVLAIDLARWRRLDVVDKALRVCAQADLPMADQDAINVVLSDDWHQIPDHWNTWASRIERRGARVIHCTMVPKPWDADYMGKFGDAFFEYLDRTAYAGSRPRRLLGLAPAVKRLSRKLPYVPTVWRVFRNSLGW